MQRSLWIALTMAQLASLTVAQLACQAPASRRDVAAAELPRAVSGPCEGLAYVFFVVAEQRDRGESREAQIRMAQESVHNRFSEDPEQALADLLRVIDAVYRRPGQRAREIEASVLEDCVVNDRGQAVLLWPAP
jgi:hypothetical protein